MNLFNTMTVSTCTCWHNRPVWKYAIHDGAFDSVVGATGLIDNPPKGNKIRGYCVNLNNDYIKCIIRWNITIA